MTLHLALAQIEHINPPCWACAGLDMPEGAQRAGLCDAHLQGRVRAFMMERGVPATHTIKPEEPLL